MGKIKKIGVLTSGGDAPECRYSGGCEGRYF